MKEESGFVIGLENEANISGTKISLDIIDETIELPMWIKGKVDANGWFTLKHSENGLFITSKGSEDHPTIEGKLRSVVRVSNPSRGDSKNFYSQIISKSIIL